jgi:hypothetical protein
MRKLIAVLLLLPLVPFIVGCTPEEALTDTIYFTDVFTDIIHADSIYTDTIDYTDEYWGEIAVPATSMEILDDASSAAKSNMQSGLVYVFANEPLAGDEKYVYFSVEMPHNYKEGTGVTISTHFTLNADEVGTKVRWKVGYSWANVGEDFPIVTTIWALSDAANNDSLKHQNTKFTTIAGTGKQIRSHLVCYLSRNSSDISDTYTDTVRLTGVSVLYQIDAPGSTSEWSK